MKMNKVIIMFLVGILAIANVSAVQYYQYNYMSRINSQVTRLHGEVTYSNSEHPVNPKINTNIMNLLSPFNIILSQFSFLGFFTINPADPLSSILPEDSIASGKPLEFYFLFSTYIDDWNNKAPANKVNYCNFTVYYDSAQAGTSTPIYSIVSASTIQNARYFVKLNKGDSVNAEMDCFFEGNRTLTIPATFEIVTPTWDCKECQYYEWYQEYLKLVKAQTLGSYVVQTWSYINKLIQLNYEVVLILFWILMIEIFLFVIGLIIYGVFWLILYLNRLAR
jgi:hypothetical protein